MKTSSTKRILLLKAKDEKFHECMSLLNHFTVN